MTNDVLTYSSIEPTILPVSSSEDPKAFQRRGEAHIKRRKLARMTAAGSALEKLHISFDTHIELHNLYRDVVLLPLEQLKVRPQTSSLTSHG